MGAWYSNGLLPNDVYEQGMKGAADSALGSAILGWKAELALSKCNISMNLDAPSFGSAMFHSVHRFQRLNGLILDGIIGPVTARYLTRARTTLYEDLYKIPNHYLAQIKSLESANDLSAQGVVDLDDWGPVQINLRLHSTITLPQAITPAWCLNYAGKQLSDFASQRRDWDAAVASWNVGIGGAVEWLNAGKLATGGTASFPDLYSRATRYVALVHQQSY